MKKEIYDVAIVGGGVTGSSLLFVLSNYSDAKKIVLVEKYSSIAAVNSNKNNNSQTLHFGDIETNYSLEKAASVKEAADLLAAYVEKYAPEAFKKNPKMVLAVGEEEVAELEKRFDEFQKLYPKLEKIERERIAELEPDVVKGRNSDQKLLALASSDGYTIDYGKLSESFVSKSQTENKKADVYLGEEVLEISKNEKCWKVRTSKRIIAARMVVVSSGPHSLIFAKRLGYGREYGILPVAGSFYKAKKILNGKVYMMQIRKLPFAAIHGDPDVENPEETRFGPTAKVLPLLERHHYSTILDFFKTSAFTFNGIISLWKIITDETIFKYVAKNMLYDLPIIGKHFFLKQVQKIVPSLKKNDIELAKNVGGIRPQVVNTKTRKMEMGEAKIVGDRIIFNITPSPGASVCLKNAEKDAILVADFVESGVHFDLKRFRDDLDYLKIS